MESPGFTKGILVGAVEGWLEAETRKKFMGRDEPHSGTMCGTGRVKHGTFCPGEPQVWDVWAVAYLQFISLD